MVKIKAEEQLGQTNLLVTLLFCNLSEAQGNTFTELSGTQI